tara:strand:+ start:28200 stop:29744 length:1545 start_codon:yes stop_codon:yes gene_type:complete
MKFIAISNITEQGLEKIFDLDLNGLPAPSIQVKPFPYNTKTFHKVQDNDTLFDFGDISFVFSQQNIFGYHSTIPKKDATHEIFTGDAYTLRFPDLKYTLNNKVMNELITDLESIFDNNKNIPVLTDDYSLKLQQIKDKSYLVHELEKSYTFKLAFLRDYEYLEKFKGVYENLELSNIVEEDEELQKILKVISADKIKHKHDKYIQYIQNKIKNSNEDDKIFWELFIENKKIKPELLLDFFKKDINILKNKHTKKIDIYKTKEKLNLLVKQVERKNNVNFSNYIRATLYPVLINPKIKDNNKPVEMDNIISFMKRNRGQGVEQNNFISINRATAANQEKIRSLSDLKKFSNLITNSEQKTIADEKRKKLFFELSDEIGLYNNEDQFVEALALLGKKPDIKKIKDVFNKKGISINDDQLEKVKEFAILNNNHKHLYFEAKPNKPFYFRHDLGLKDERLTHVIVPNTINPELKSKLQRTDLNVVTYNPKDKNSRLRALYRCRELFIDSNKKPNQKLK